MNLAVLALNVYVPMSIRRKKLASLFEATAKAFEVVVPDCRHLSFEETLEKYAEFTKDEIERRLRSGEDMEGIKNDLFVHARTLGGELRKHLHLKSTADVLSAGRALYRAIGIDFEGSSTGAVVMHSCFFSTYYTEAVCRIMSSLDEGIAAGLSSGGRLRFSQRITEGKPCCKAFLRFESDAQ